MSEIDNKKTEVDIGCDEKKCIFVGLSSSDQVTNRQARKDALDGKESSKTLGTMCGNCARLKLNEKALEEEMKKPFTYKPQTELQKAT